MYDYFKTRADFFQNVNGVEYVLIGALFAVSLITATTHISCVAEGKYLLKHLPKKRFRFSVSVHESATFRDNIGASKLRTI